MTTPQDQPPRISLLAILALILALLSFVLSILAGIPAIILGSIAGRRIDNNPNRLAGAGYARWAVNLAFVGSAITTTQSPFATVMIPLRDGTTGAIK